MRTAASQGIHGRATATEMPTTTILAMHLTAKTIAHPSTSLRHAP